MPHPRGPGRSHAAFVAQRRLEAEQYLAANFPRSAMLWERIRASQLSSDELAEAVGQMIIEARSTDATELMGDSDKLTLNPEQAVARVLTRVSMREKAIAACRAELSALDAVRVAIEQILAAHQDAATTDVAEVTAAAAQRPTVDREVERRTLDVLRAGVSRADLIRLKQNADKLWSSPRSWANLPQTVGRFTISDQPPRSDVEHELLPPSSHLHHYCRDASAFRKEVANVGATELMKATTAELMHWISLHYPGRTIRQPAVMAVAWASLLLLQEPAIQESDYRIDVLMPSAWKAGRVMRITSS